MLHGDDFANQDMDETDDDRPFDIIFNMPAGEEGTVESGAGGELAICQDILDQLSAGP